MFTPERSLLQCVRWRNVAIKLIHSGKEHKLVFSRPVTVSLGILIALSVLTVVAHLWAFPRGDGIPLEQTFSARS